MIFDAFIESFTEHPEKLIISDESTLDFDTNDETVDWVQKGRFFNGYYGHYYFLFYLFYWSVICVQAVLIGRSTYVRL